MSVVDSSGRVAERLACHGPNPTNCAFAPAGRTLYVTEVGIGHVESLAVPCDGLPLHRPRRQDAPEEVDSGSGCGMTSDTHLPDAAAREHPGRGPGKR